MFEHLVVKLWMDHLIHDQEPLTTLAKEKQEVPSEKNSAKAEVANDSEDCQVLVKFVHDSDVVSEHVQGY